MKTVVVYSFGSVIYTKEMNNEQHAKNFINKIKKTKSIASCIITDIEDNLDSKIAQAKTQIAQCNYYSKSITRYGRYL